MGMVQRPTLLATELLQKNLDEKAYNFYWGFSFSNHIYITCSATEHRLLLKTISWCGTHTHTHDHHHHILTIHEALDIFSLGSCASEGTFFQHCIIFDCSEWPTSPESLPGLSVLERMGGDHTAHARQPNSMHFYSSSRRKAMLRPCGLFTAPNKSVNSNVQPEQPFQSAFLWSSFNNKLIFII